jgi:hypothetical protein
MSLNCDILQNSFQNNENLSHFEINRIRGGNSPDRDSKCKDKSALNTSRSKYSVAKSRNSERLEKVFETTQSLLKGEKPKEMLKNVTPQLENRADYSSKQEKLGLRQMDSLASQT